MSGFFSTLTQRIVGAVETKNVSEQECTGTCGLLIPAQSFSIKVPAASSGESSKASNTSMLTLATFYDTTPPLSFGSLTSGVLELDDGLARLLGVDKGFYIAVALAYLEFLNDKEVCFWGFPWVQPGSAKLMFQGVYRGIARLTLESLACSELGYPMGKDGIHVD